MLDIGCGGGLLCEPLARLGAAVVGADPSAANIAAARLHAEAGGLSIDYRVTAAEALADAGERFDVVLAMEVVEPWPTSACSVALRRDGKARRTDDRRHAQPDTQEFCPCYRRRRIRAALAAPRHPNWDKFVTPAELERALARAGLRVSDQTGVAYNPLSDTWRLSADMAVIYMMVAEWGE